MIVLGIETSCDETAAAIVNGERHIVANRVLTQINEHRPFGGIVPEIAARAHLDHIDRLVAEALAEAKIEFAQLDGVAATAGPGLIGGLLVGVTTAKAIAAVHDLPFLAVNHLEGHALTARLTDDVAFPCMLEREDPRDGFLSPVAPNLAGLAEGAVVGTTSLRRRSQILHRRPDLSVALYRGNVETRIRKLGEGQVDATLLAVAGLRRLGLADALTSVMEPDEMLPAVGQGAIGIACRAGDDRTLALLAPLNHLSTLHRVTAERALLEVLDGSCRTPIAALANVAEDGTLVLTGLVARPDGSEVLTTERHGPVADARAMGIDAGEELRRRAGPGFMDALD